MAASIALTPRPDLAAMIVDVDTDGLTLTSLWRDDANGSAPVRTGEGVLPSAAPPVLFDYDLALAPHPAIGTSWVRYTATFADGPTVTASFTGWADEISESRVHVPVWPTRSAWVRLITNYDARRRSGNTIHEVIDRPDPAVTLAPLRTRGGTLELWAESYVDAAALAAVHELRHVLMLRQTAHAGLDMFYVVDGDVAVSPYAVADPIRWAVRVPYLEVARPTGPLLENLGWTFADVRVEFATFADLPGEFGTFADLAVEDRT